MNYPIEEKLVIGISTNALFDLRKEDELFQNEGLDAYREYHKANRSKVLKKGVAFPFIKRFLQINDQYSTEMPVEVVLLSKNGAETVVRVFNAIEHYKLDITRAVFTSGGSPYSYIPAFNVSLFLATNEHDVKLAVESGLAAGRIVNTAVSDEGDVSELRVAFDFDGVLADDEAEKIFKQEGIERFYEYEKEHRKEPLKPGLLADFFRKLSRFQKLEADKVKQDPEYAKLLKTAIITARSAPAHERVVRTLNSWGVSVDEMFLMGGVEKKKVLEIFKPHLYFDDQLAHLDSNIKDIPLVHIPFGVANK